MSGVMQVNLADEPTIVYYEGPNRELHSVTIDEAHSWLREGYFTSEMLFLFAPEGADIKSGAFRVWTLKELIERNGRAAPFLMCDEIGRDREMEGMSELSEELEELKSRSLGIKTSIQPLQERLTVAQAERLRIKNKVDSLYPSIGNNETPLTRGNIDEDAECVVPSSDEVVVGEMADRSELIESSDESSIYSSDAVTVIEVNTSSTTESSSIARGEVSLMSDGLDEDAECMISLCEIVVEEEVIEKSEVIPSSEELSSKLENRFDCMYRSIAADEVSSDGPDEDAECTIEDAVVEEIMEKSEVIPSSEELSTDSAVSLTRATEVNLEELLGRYASLSIYHEEKETEGISALSEGIFSRECMQRFKETNQTLDDFSSFVVVDRVALRQILLDHRRDYSREEMIALRDNPRTGRFHKKSVPPGSISNPKQYASLHKLHFDLAGFRECARPESDLLWFVSHTKKPTKRNEEEMKVSSGRSQAPPRYFSREEMIAVRDHTTPRRVALLPDAETDLRVQQWLAALTDKKRLGRKYGVAQNRYWHESSLHGRLSEGHFDWRGLFECARPNSDLYWYLMPWPNKPDKGKASVNDAPPRDYSREEMITLRDNPTRCDVALLPDFDTEQLAQQQLAAMGDQERLRKKSALANRRRDWPELKWLYVSLSKWHFDWRGFCECARPNSDLYWSLLPWPDKPEKAWKSGREKAERPMIFGEEVIEVKIDSLIEAIKAVDVNPGSTPISQSMPSIHSTDKTALPRDYSRWEMIALRDHPTRCDVPLLPHFDMEQQAQKRVAAMGEKERLQRKFSLARDGKSRDWNSQYLSLSKWHFDWRGFCECARPESDVCWYLLPWPDTQGTTISCEETVKADPLIHVVRVFEVKPSSAPTSHESTMSMRPTKVTVAPRIFGRRGERSEKKSARNKPDAPQQSDAPVWPRGMASTNIPKVRPRFIRQKSFEGATAGQSAIIKPKTPQQSEMPSSATVNNESAVASSRTSSSPPLTLPVIIPPGGDPFALLKSCEGARRKLAPGTVNQLFTQLRMRYNQFNTEQQMRLAKQMIDLFPEHKVTECTLCDITVTPSRVINHICHETHVNAMNGVVCADAFNFLLNAVRTFSFDDSLEERTIVKSETLQQSDMASSNLPMISPPPGVDPFALLKSCEGANRKMRPKSIVPSFKSLKGHFLQWERPKVLDNLVRSLFDMGKRCAFCDTLPGNASDLIVHICSDTHIEAMNGAVCKDAFDFWWNTVVTNKDLYSKQSEVVEKVDDQPVEKKVLPDNKIPICSKSSTQSIAIAQIFPPTGVDPFALIKSCEGAKRKMVDNVKMQFKFLKARMRAGNVKLLEHATSTLFEKGHVCALCGAWLFSAPEMINHIATTMHIEKMNGLVCADAFDFWWNAVVVKQPEIPTCSKSSTRKVYRQSITYPQISPPPGVDPFALLKSCEGAERKMVDDVAIQFDLLNARMREGNINRLDQKTSKLFEKGQECAFCGTKVYASSAMIHHISTITHISKMSGSVCADAFDFWWNSCGN